MPKQNGGEYGDKPNSLTSAGIVAYLIDGEPVFYLGGCLTDRTPSCLEQNYLKNPGIYKSQAIMYPVNTDTKVNGIEYFMKYEDLTS